jgi:hypothetical protein
MSWFALLLSVSEVASATALSSPSNTPPKESNPQHDYVRAQPAEPQSAARDDFTEHPVTIEWRGGIASPTGLFGGALSYSPIPQIGLDCGAGTNLRGLQLACGLRARLMLGGSPSSASAFARGRRRAITLTSGVSTGPYVDTHALQKVTWVDGEGPADRSYTRAYWWNTDLGVEGRYEGAVVRGFVGVALLQNPGAGTDLVSGNQRAEPPTTAIWYVGIGLGVAP